MDTSFQSAQHEEDYGPSLVQSLWRYRWLVAAATVLGGLLGLLLSLLQPTIYEATAELVLSDPSTGAFLGDEGGTDPDVIATHVLIESERATSTSVLQRSAEILGDGADPAALAGRLVVTPNTEVSSMSVTGLGPTPGEAARLANAVAEAYQDVAAQNVRNDALAALRELAPVRRQTRVRLLALASGGSGPRIESERRAVLERLIQFDVRADALRAKIALIGSGVDYVESAVRPDVPVEPNPLRDAALMAVLGLGAGAVIAWWKAGRERTASDPEDAVAMLHAPLLGEIPRFEVGIMSAPALRDLSAEAAEAYHFVVVSLEAAVEHRATGTLLVVSPAPGDGKTTTTRLVASAMATNGSRVIAVDADTRTRGLTAVAQHEEQLGLTDLVSDHLDVESCMQPLDEASSAVSLVPAGRAGRSGPGLFRSADFRRALMRIKDQADVVLIDTPTMTRFTDTFAMADDADGIIVVVNRGTPMRVLAQTRARLSMNRSSIVGYVFNRASANGSRHWQSMSRRVFARSTTNGQSR